MYTLSRKGAMGSTFVFYIEFSLLNQKVQLRLYRVVLVL